MRVVITLTDFDGSKYKTVEEMELAIRERIANEFEFEFSEAAIASVSVQAYER